jgi:hypothetical protein
MVAYFLRLINNAHNEPLIIVKVFGGFICIIFIYKVRRVVPNIQCASKIVD